MKTESIYDSKGNLLAIFSHTDKETKKYDQFGAYEGKFVVMDGKTYDRNGTYLGDGNLLGVKIPKA